MKRRPYLFSVLLLLAAVGLWLAFRNGGSPGQADPPAAGSGAKPAIFSGLPGAPPPGGAGSKTGDGKPVAAVAAPEAKPAPALTGTEKQKEIDKEHMTKLRDGIFAYKAKYGHYPEYLSQLAPEFVTADTLVSPRKKNQRGDGILATDHPDPGITEPSYGYEFSNLEFRDGRTFAEIKEVQRSDWGDVVPMLRFFGYDKVLNMSVGGEIFETRLDWEWDAATLDVVDKLGWGPGLAEGDMVKVKVVGPDGAPLTGAKVWADGRNYSFDLPNRPYTTDAEGYASIPVGVDQDRTALALRLEASGYTAPFKQFARGETPESVTLTAETASQSVSGRLINESGAPLADTRVFLRQGDGDTKAGGTLAQVRTDSEGRWQATLNPQDAKSFSAEIGVPGGPALKTGESITVDAGAAASGNAVIVAPVRR
ncbi:MAG: hypothetical protein V4726_24835 [Verrucomicrobiota bacterium]